MISFQIGRARCPFGRAVMGVLTVFVLLVLVSSASAEVSPGWGKWWLPPDRSEHGHAIDSLFRWIFWITMITFVGVELLLLAFLIKYRARPNSGKAHFSHGNPRLEMAWTIAPAVILALLALGSKKVWDNYRYAPAAEDPNRAKILVIGEQFKWNIIYPGPDGKFGRYLIYPKPTDAKWPVGPDGKPTIYDGTPGPASYPYEQSLNVINRYIGSENPLGKDFADPDGKDDDYRNALGRKLFLPVNRAVEVQLSSKDVIHDFFLPNHRVKLDAVPGMRGRLYFTATMTSAERAKSSVRNIPVDELEKLLTSGAGKDLVIVIDESTPGTEQNKNRDRTGWRYVDSSGGRATTIIRHGAGFSEGERQKQILTGLRKAGVSEVRITGSGEWELVCEELCGQGHNTMRAAVVVLDQDAYDKLNFDKPGRAAPATAPAVAAAVGH